MKNAGRQAGARLLLAEARVEILEERTAKEWDGEAAPCENAMRKKATRDEQKRHVIGQRTRLRATRAHTPLQHST